MLLSDIAAGSPGGDNLENDPDFGAMERAARGKPEQQHGELIVPREDPDWAQVDALGTGLLARTHDLRVLVQLAVARLHLSGVPAFADMLALIRDVVTTRWPTVHPLLDAEDENDPTLRANALLALASPVDVLPQLRTLTLASSPRAGKVAWRDIAIATGVVEAPAGIEKLSETVIRAAFQETDRDRLTQLVQSLGGAIADADGIPAAFDAHAGLGTGPQMTELVKLLRDVLRSVERYAPAEETAEPDAAAAASAGDPGDQADGGRAVGVTAFAITSVATRAEAMRMLDLVAGYYSRYEPSSPLPLLLDRARRLADMNFMDVLRDLAPAGLGQAQIVAGAANE